MIAIICVDDNNGMTFNKRRQSQDRNLRGRVLKEAAGSKLWMNRYSLGQFEAGAPEFVETDEDFLDKAGPGEFCFVENCGLMAREEKIEKIILYRWNRRYPSDFQLDIPLKEHGWKLVSTENFEGSSHEKITKEVYIRCKN